MTFPGLLDMLAEGWTNYLIQTGPSKSQQVAATKLGVPIENVEQLVRSVNPRLCALAAPGGHTDQGNIIEALLDPDAFDQPLMKKARLLSYANLIHVPCEPRIHCVTLRFARSLERHRFVNALKSLFVNLQPWPFYGNVYKIHGQVGFTGEEEKIFDILHITLSGVSRISQQSTFSKSTNDRRYWLTAAIAAPVHKDKSYDDQLSTRFAEWLRQTGPPREQPRDPLQRSDLTTEDLAKIHDKYHLHPLPAGWFYTGVYYVNMNGEKSYQHPNFEEFITEYLEGENNKIAAKNARLASHPVPDLFND